MSVSTIGSQTPHRSTIPSNQKVVPPLGQISDLGQVAKAPLSARKIPSSNSGDGELDATQQQLNNRNRFSITSIIGNRMDNEDGHVQFLLNDLVVIAIFDGHNGDRVSKFCALQLEKSLTKYYNKSLEKNDGLFAEFESVLDDTVQELNDMVIQKPALNEIGTTSLIAVINFKTEKIYISNIGDSRLIVGYQNGQFWQTKDQKPCTDEEMARLRNAGAKVEDICGTHRINKILSVSRSIGDKYMKEYVICKQDYYEFSIKDYAYILLACDGLYDVFSSSQINEIMQQIYTKKITNKELFDVMSGRMDVNTQVIPGKQEVKLLFQNVDVNAPMAVRVGQMLTKMAFQKGSTDNISAAVHLRPKQIPASNTEKFQQI